MLQSKLGINCRAVPAATIENHVWWLNLPSGSLEDKSSIHFPALWPKARQKHAGVLSSLGQLLNKPGMCYHVCQVKNKNLKKQELISDSLWRWKRVGIQLAKVTQQHKNKIEK